MRVGARPQPIGTGLALCAFSSLTDHVQPQPSYLLTSTHLLQKAVPDHTGLVNPYPYSFHSAASWGGFLFLCQAVSLSSAACQLHDLGQTVSPLSFSFLICSGGNENVLTVPMLVSYCDLRLQGVMGAEQRWHEINAQQGNAACYLSLCSWPLAHRWQGSWPGWSVGFL